MRKAILIIAGFCMFLFSRTAAQCPSGMAGTYTIGPAGSFTSITSAFVALQANGLANHVILELQGGYSAAAETFPLTIPATPCQHLFSITVRPAPGTSGHTISTGAAATTLIIDSVQNLVIDGRPGGTGTAKELTIQNTALNGSAVKFNSGATANTLHYLYLKSTATTVTNGIVVLNATAGSGGIHNNKIRFCDIGNPAAFSSNLLYAAGNATNPNSNNEISNNNCFNYFSNTINSSGISIAAGNTDWTIADNSFFQTAGTTNFGSNALSNAAVRINTPSGGGFTIRGNAIGGTAPNCGGTALTCTGAGSFTGIFFSSDTVLASSIDNNRMANISLTLTAGSSFPAGIYVAAGKPAIGTLTGNTIGSQSVTNSISITSTATGTNPTAGFAGIYVTSQDTVTVSNNLVGGIAGSGSGRLITYGIQLSGAQGAYIVSGNTIGSPVLPNSISNNATAYALLQGITSNAAAVVRTQSIHNNLIANISSTTVSGGGQVAGIYTSSGTHLITGNTVRNLYGSSFASGTSQVSVLGISSISGTGPQAITGNTIHTLVNTHPWGSMGITGINVCNGSATAVLRVAGNLIHSLSSASVGNLLITGIYATCGNTSVYNNMVRLGIDADGNPVSGEYEIRGIFQGSASAPHRYSFNAVYLGGGSNGGYYTYAFFNSDSLRPVTITNNIFVNARTNAGSGKHYATVVASSRKQPAWLTMNGNLYYAPGTGGHFGAINGTSYTSISAWRDITGQDSLSGIGNPNFINPAGNAASVNLHLTGTTPAEGAGIPDAAIAEDYDSQTRAALSPVDMGADAANLTPLDIFTPSIRFARPGNTTSLLNRTIQARITDAASGVHITGSLQPRIWFRRAAPVASAWASTQGVLLSGNGNDGIWNLTIDYSVLGGTVSPLDVYQYYFAAQDVAGNIEIIPGAGAVHSNVNTQVSAPANSLSYSILEIVPPVVNVGTGQPYTTLTGNGGLFQFINRSVMTGNVTVNISSDLLEPGIHSLNADSTYGYQLLIRPSAAATRTISNSANLTRAMIRLIDMKNIVIDGRFNGSGRYLRFVNTHTDPAICAPVLLIDSSSSGILIRGNTIESNVSELFGFRGAVVIGAAGINKQIEIRENQVRDAAGSPGTAGLVSNAIKSNSNNNRQLTIAGNEIFNFAQFGVSFSTVGDSCVIDSNHFYFNAPLSSVVPAAVHIENGRAHIIKNNFIGGSAINCGGAPWISNTTYSATFTGINVYVPSGGLPSQIINNTIQNIRMANIAEGSITGIRAYGNMMITGNQVGHPSLPGSIVNDATAFWAFTTGIQAVATDSAVVIDNSVANIAATGASTNAVLVGIYMSGSGKGVVKNNHIWSLTSAGMATYYSALSPLQGIYLWNGSRGYEVENNAIHDLKSLSTAPNIKIRGITATINGNAYSNFIRRNRIYNLENLSDSGWMYGVEIMIGAINTENNQIAITNGANTNRVNIYGIYDQGDTSYHHYNTVYIGGTATGNLNSCAYKLHDGRLKRFQNNILYNERTDAGGTHVAMSAAFNPNPDPKWTSTSSNYNFFVARDSAKINAWTFFNQPQSMISWRAVSQADSSSFAALTTNLPADSFFQSVATGNLNINANNPLCWYVNGKGLPVPAISSDYDSAAGVRSTAVPTGATDIGADEFTTATLPPALIVLGRHLPGDTDSLMLNGRLIATIAWGNTGTLPVFGPARYYSGTWPNDTTNGMQAGGARTMNAWLDIPVTGGSGYSYTLTLYYDSSMLGHIQNAAQLVLHKRHPGESGSWQMLFPAQVNTTAKTVSAAGLTGFSEFTGAESTAPLATPGSGICAGGTAVYTTNTTGAGYTYQWQVNTGTGFVNISNNAVYSGATGPALTISAPSSGYYGYLYRCVTQTGSGTVNSPDFKLKITSTWTGAADTGWANPGNWSCGVVPDAHTDVIIKSGLARYPVINTAISCRSIFASPGAAITVQAGGAIQLTGN